MFTTPRLPLETLTAFKPQFSADVQNTQALKEALEQYNQRQPITNREIKALATEIKGKKVLRRQRLRLALGLSLAGLFTTITGFLTPSVTQNLRENVLADVQEVLVEADQDTEATALGQVNYDLEAMEISDSAYNQLNEEQQKVVDKLVDRFELFRSMSSGGPENGGVETALPVLGGALGVLLLLASGVSLTSAKNKKYTPDARWFNLFNNDEGYVDLEARLEELKVEQSESKVTHLNLKPSADSTHKRNIDKLINLNNQLELELIYKFTELNKKTPGILKNLKALSVEPEVMYLDQSDRGDIHSVVENMFNFMAFQLLQNNDAFKLINGGLDLPPNVNQYTFERVKFILMSQVLSDNNLFGLLTPDENAADNFSIDQETIAAQALNMAKHGDRLMNHMSYMNQLEDRKKLLLQAKQELENIQTEQAFEALHGRKVESTNAQVNTVNEELVLLGTALDYYPLNLVDQLTESGLENIPYSQLASKKKAFDEALAAVSEMIGNDSLSITKALVEQGPVVA